MCGIAAICNFSGEPVSTAVLRRMTDAMAHRGPDGEGHYTDGPIGLGHRRLAIIDLSDAGRQPIANETGDVLVVYNGEIYNFEELRLQLEGAGHRFHSRTDSEVVVHAYEEWGEACVERFNGMFAFVLYDRRGRGGRLGRLFAARDRYGIKPLYYCQAGDVLLLASEIKAFLTHPSFSVRVSDTALSDYFTFQNVFDDGTLFEDVRLLPPATVLTLEAAAPHRLQRWRYWDFCFRGDECGLTLDDAAAELHHRFERGVVRQLVSDVPVGSYLSGGMDSGSITAVAARHIPRIHTFTAGFDLSSATGLELGFDERPASEVMANLFKSEHYEVVLHAGDMEHVLPDLIWHLEDLRVGQSYPNHYVARLASKFVKVVLSGGGGDELFGGYPWRYYRGLNGSGPDAYYESSYDYWQRLIPDQDRPQFFNDASWARLRHHSPRDSFRAVFRDGNLALATVEDKVNASLYFEAKTFLHGLFVVEDKLSMAHSLETRVPFLDNDLVDFALRLPATFKLRELATAPAVDEEDPGKHRRYHAQPTADGKVVLRLAMARLIPPEISERAKQGFSAPDASWFRGDSIDYVNTLLRAPRARIYDYVSPVYVGRMLDEHSGGRVNHRLLIWSLLSFEWWLRKFAA